MNSLLRTSLCVAAFSILAGCAHSIRITPDPATMPVASAGARSPLVVGYYISDEERQRRVVTPGGGGDKVEYAPYSELESGLYRVLGNVFADVRPMKSPNDKAVVDNKGIALAFRPVITTNSSSDSVLTWPPTDFEVIIDINAADSSGKVLWTEKVSGSGKASFSEFKSDFGLAAKRASAAALKQLQARLQSADMATVFFPAAGKQAQQSDSAGK